MHRAFIENCSCVTLPFASMQSCERRFKSQVLLDDKALLACMAYVDLNPTRTHMAKTLKGSEHTYVKRRIEGRRSNKQRSMIIEAFVGSKAEDIGLPFTLNDYLELVD